MKHSYVYHICNLSLNLATKVFMLINGTILKFNLKATTLFSSYKPFKTFSSNLDLLELGGPVTKVNDGLASNLVFID